MVGWFCFDVGTLETVSFLFLPPHPPVRLTSLDLGEIRRPARLIHANECLKSWLKFFFFWPLAGRDFWCTLSSFLLIRMQRAWLQSLQIKSWGWSFNILTVDLVKFVGLRPTVCQLGDKWREKKPNESGKYSWFPNGSWMFFSWLSELELVCFEVYRSVRA